MGSKSKTNSVAIDFNPNMTTSIACAPFEQYECVVLFKCASFSQLVFVDFLEHLRGEPVPCEEGWGLPVVQEWTLTAANGDALWLTNVDVSCPTGPSQFHGTGTITVHGGTGRFVNATDSGSVEGDADLMKGEVVCSFDGVLSIPNKN